MRLWHLVFAILIVACLLAIARDPAGRVALIVFLTGLGEVAFGTTSLLALFQSVGSIGEARTLAEHAEAVAATAVVLALATLFMTGLLFLGAWLVQATVP